MACVGWSVVQLDHEELEPMREYFWPIEAGIEVQRTINRADMKALCVALTRLCAPTAIHTDRMCIVSGLHRGEKKCIGPKSKGADLWIKLWEAIEKVRDNDMRFDVKAYRTSKRQQKKTSSRSLSWRGPQNLQEKQQG